VLEAGAAGYLLKDISSQELTNAIKTVFRGEAVLHPAIARKVLARFSRDGKDLTGGDSKSDVLSDRENTIIKLAAKGMSNNEIAEELHLSVRTIESHLGSIFNKMGVGSRIEAVITAMKKGWFTLEELS
jgi:NarL family two-component system response regulator LiaR